MALKPISLEEAATKGNLDIETCRLILRTLEVAVRREMEVLQKAGKPKPAQVEVKAADLCYAFVSLAANKWGVLARHICETVYGLKSTDDIGNYVYKMIEVDLLKESASDEGPHQFHKLFPLGEVLDSKAAADIKEIEIESVSEEANIFPMKSDLVRE